MPDKSITILFQPKGLDKILSGYQNLINSANVYQNQLTKQSMISQTAFGALEKQKMAWQTIMTETDRTVDELETAEKVVGQINSSLKNIQNPFETLLNSVVPFGGALTKQMGKLTSLTDAFVKVKQAGGFMKVFSDYTASMGQKATMLSNGLKEAFGGGLQGLLSKATIGIQGMMTAMGGLLAAAWPILVAVAAIIAIVFTLKRMWVNNIGGMQTYWFKMVGAVKDTWNRFVITFDQALRKLSPLLKIVFGAVWTIFSFQLKYTTGLFKLLWAYLSPIFDLIGEIGTILQDAFSPLIGDGQESANVLEAMGKAFEWLAGVISFGVKISLFPLRLVLMGIGFVIKLVVIGIKTLIDVFKILWDRFKNLKSVQAIWKGIQDAIKATVSVLETMLKPYQKIIDGAKKVSEWLGLSKKETKDTALETEKLHAIQNKPITAGNVSNRTTNYNNNSSVDVYSSGPISPENAPAIGQVVSGSMITASRVV